MPPTPPQKSGYLPSLDGWRAIAILGVLMVHDIPWRLGPFSNLSFREYGSYGVVLFFAISGILISTRILEEEELTGAFHLRSFYIRRLFRIQPAALLYLAVIAVLTLSGVLHELWRFWFSALLLYVNFLYHPGPVSDTFGAFTGHFWTLAVEEHFYLLISLLLFFVRRHRIAVMVSLLLLIKLGQAIALHFDPDPLRRRTYWQIHALLFPCLAALLLRTPRIRAAAVRWLHPEPVLLLTGLAFALCHGLLFENLIHGRLAEFETHLLTYAFTFWIVATILHPRSPITRLLEAPPIRFAGRLSYSIYLWHVLFFASLPYITFPPLVFLDGHPARYIATLAVAMASYYLVEKPLIRLGHRLAPSATPGRRYLADLPTETPAASALIQPLT
jgi:peptidoglycan/LPS O-acetylase OafA/YrhL